MVKFNSKRLLAVIVATTMVLGSSLTAFAGEGSVNSEGTGTYEGNIPAFPAASVTLPTIAAGTFNYTADPNGLIAKTESALHSGTTWDGNGVYFLSDTNKYTAESKPIEVTNQSAYSFDVEIELKETTAGKNVAYSTDKTFADSTDKEIYLALSDGTNTVAMSQKTEGNSTTKEPAVLKVTIPGKPSNYKLGANEAGTAYEIAQISNVSADSWNKASVVATGALNQNTIWTSGSGDAAIVFPVVTVTYKLTYGAAPVYIKSGVEQTVALSHKDADAAITIKQIDFKGTVVPTSMYEASTAAANTATTLTLKSGFTSFAYGRTPDDGLVFTVTYSDGFQETFTVVKW